LTMLVLTHRTWQKLQRTIQVCSGLLVLLVVLICVLTLVLHDGHKGQRRTKTESLFRTDRPLSTKDIYISVKTTKKFHSTRLPVILKTWFNLAPKQTFFFTDEDDAEVRREVGGQLVVTPCPSDHSRQALSCKMQYEFNHFLNTHHKWFCHFDDDQYVNVPRLVSKLAEFPTNQAWYLGKPSIQTPLQILDRDNMDTQKSVRFWFGTGGAGFCLSRSLTDRLVGLADRRQFAVTADRMRLPDDVAMGYIIEMLADVPLTVLEEFHSHLEPLHLISNLHDQISFSYAAQPANLVPVAKSVFSTAEDPSRFLSIHCELFPATAWCSR